jgi:uncharacterized protein YcbX
VQLSGIFVYPIKACAGISLERSDVVERGLAFDRRYMLADLDGNFISQREVPRLCLVGTAFDGACIAVTAAGRETLRVPRELDGSTLERRRYRVWGASGGALRHPEGSRWFSELLDDEVNLLYMPDDERREVSPRRARAGDIVSFADGYPLLIVSEASLDDLNSRLPAPLDMRRFRPSLIVSGCAPYAEDDFSSVRIGAISFRGVKRCPRCAVITVDPDTGERDPTPLRALARYRQEDGDVYFGMNLIHDRTGPLQRGDAVYPL